MRSRLQRRAVMGTRRNRGAEFPQFAAPLAIQPGDSIMQKQVSLADLREAHRVAAEVAAKNPRYLPIFERMERELAAASADSPAKRAARIAERSRRTRALI